MFKWFSQGPLLLKAGGRRGREGKLDLDFVKSVDETAMNPISASAIAK